VITSIHALKSIKAKLHMLVMAAVSVAMVVVFVISALGLAIKAHSDLQSEIAALGDATAFNCASAMIFNDSKSATETLHSLSGRGDIVRGELLDIHGRLFADYRHAEIGLQTQMVNVGSRLFEEVIERPIVNASENIGVLRLTVDMSRLWYGVVLQGLVILLGLIVAVVAAYTVTRRLNKFILDPIARLANLAREVSSTRNFSLRAEKISNDELGVLTTEFNEMLAQIETRDEQLLESYEALAQTHEAIVLTDTAGHVRYVNLAFSGLFGYSAEDVKGTPLESVLMEGTPASTSTSETLAIVMKTGSFSGEVYRRHKCGTVIPIWLTFNQIKNIQGEVVGLVAAITDITERKKNEELVWRQANFDSLTGLSNRRMFNAQLQHEINQADRTNSQFQLLMFDLDHFKGVNDTLGHDAGDLLLTEVAQRLQSCVRKTDVVGRQGGDEFTIILSQIGEYIGSNQVVQKILKKISEPYYIRDELVYVTASIGVACYPTDASNEENLLICADQAMYAAKKQGRNCAYYFTEELQATIQKRMRIAQDLRSALEQDQFQVYYQPIVDMHNGEIFKAEALLRWIHPERGFIGPAEFIPVAEETGLIIDIGNWVFEQSTRQVAIWRAAGYPHFQISVNKSPVQFRSELDSVPSWLDHLSLQGLDGDSVTIEITEGMLMDSSKLVFDKLLQFRDANISVSLDDFGTGYSSLSYLNKYDIDYLKIDQSFVRNLSANSNELSLCEAIIMMAHKLGIKVVAEGIETPDQLNLLRRAGCDFGQGYLFSKPIPAKEFEGLMLTSRIQDLILNTTQTASVIKVAE
jgi:diguanylate cyclase (GGDEF)-like protein/PAS domain S-box-containing protein